jgi:hypothetical protein
MPEGAFYGQEAMRLESSRNRRNSMNGSHHSLEKLEHRFHSIEGQLRVIVRFAPAEYSSKTL